MSKLSRTLARRKARNDNKARNHGLRPAKGEQSYRERHKMNGNAPATAQPELETKKFTEAEVKALKQKMQKYQEAANVVNEWLSFLKEQYGIPDNEGWQLGEGCFVRPLQGMPVKAVEGAPKATAEPGKKPKVQPKKKAATTDLPPLAQGETAATVAQNGQLEPQPTL